jgi:two-component system, NarL family, nitrate/nitrite response regulator NarL
MTIRLVLADDHPLMLDALARLLGQEPDMEVAARCTDGETALRAAREHRPDILILDLRMPRLGGMEVLRRVAGEAPGARVVILAGELDEDGLLEAVRLGARGVVLKEAGPEALVRCVRAVQAGGQWLDHRVTGRALERLLARESDRQRGAGVLTPREAELARLVGEGLRNKEIAARTGISEGTVKIHLHRIYDKLGVTSRVGLANHARERR